MRKAKAFGFFCAVIFLGLFLFPQTVEIKDGVRIVHNVKGGMWGAKPKIDLELVRKIGDIDTEDENLAFNAPGDLVEDSAGNIYIADAANFRIQKFDKDGKFLASFGRQGQGPGEYASLSSLAVDSEDRLHILDGRQRRIQVLSEDGKVVKTIRFLKNNIASFRLTENGLFLVQQSVRDPRSAKLIAMLKIVDENESMKAEFCRQEDFGETLTNQFGNFVTFSIGPDGSAVASFAYQNRIEKYSPGGKLLWRADRPLSFGTDIIEKGKLEQTAGMTRYSAPKMNACSKGIAVDAANRAWVVTYRRQIKPEEVIGIEQISGPSGGSIKRTGNTDLRTTDVYELEIFDPDGVLLGAIPVSHFIDGIWIYEDRLYLLDRDRGVAYSQYRIVERGRNGVGKPK